ncbi:CHAP domain-containing protein [Streptomyces sp. SID13031]|uniref:CHAP domain-containing protein n=1 Tax=Streptomyces sp. SID13031 TaxID=2706046 RepID=UPI0013CABF83|nr:CHAP domain-containing protein [Streptomyces sp. SID13031]NEA30748.1 CHAP domain-containing protein [Streptomyces sp. SID13031]
MAPAQAAARTYSAIGVTADGRGYAGISNAGEVYAFGSTVYRGNPSGFSGVITGVSVTASGQGYAAISSSGQVYAYGAVQSRGNPTGFTGSIVGISVTADGQGYAAISSAGQVYAYGTVQSRGNPTGFTGSIVGISVTANGQGYAAISSTGQVYAYGTVQHRGNPTGFTNGIAGVSVTGDGQGYTAISGYGQVYAYGTVRYWGNGDPGSSSQSSVRSKIATIATAQADNGARNLESPTGTKCNFYTTALGAGISGSGVCNNGWRYQDWCADFARWTWGQAGAVTGGLDAGAISFRTYGTTRGTWHAGPGLNGIQPGDVIGYQFGTSGTGDDHVNVVVSVSSTGTITAVGGNQSHKVNRWTFQRGSASVNGKAISGYTSPVA